jgi:hypothetical protein
MTYVFRWNEWNEYHIARHGVACAEAQYVVEYAARGFPRYDGQGKYRAWGQTTVGRYLQVAYIFSPPGVVYVIHARDLTEIEKRRLRRQGR